MRVSGSAIIDNANAHTRTRTPTCGCVQHHADYESRETSVDGAAADTHSHKSVPWYLYFRKSLLEDF